MILKKRDDAIGNFLQFSPYIFFFITYIFLYMYSLHTKNFTQPIPTIIQGLPLFAAFTATVYAFFTFKEKLKINKKIEIFLSGAGAIETMYGYFSILYLVTFNHIMAKTNGTLIAITLGLLYIPAYWIMPIIFIFTAFISIIIANLPATIIILLPIGYGIALSLHSSSPCMAATIIGGALCGNHIILYFQAMKLETKADVKIWLYHIKRELLPIIIATISTIILLSQYHCQQISSNIYTSLQTSLHFTDYITIAPYIFLCITRFFQIDLLISFTTATAMALIMQIITHKIIFLDAITTIFEGCYTKSIMGSLLLLHIFIAGLTKIIQYNGGFSWILEKLELKINELSLSIPSAIIITTIITNIFTIIDTRNSQCITYPITTLTPLNHLQKNKINLLSSIITTINQTIIPYGSILFLTEYISKCSYIHIMQYMIYPILTMIVTLLIIVHDNIHLEGKLEN